VLDLLRPALGAPAGRFGSISAVATDQRKRHYSGAFDKLKTRKTELRDSLMFALKKRRTEAEGRASAARPEVRLPLTPKTPMNLDKAIDEVMARFQKTLDYLAKRPDLANGQPSSRNQSESRREKPWASFLAGRRSSFECAVSSEKSMGLPRP